jgi:signal transduction histidine kinase
MYSLDLKSNSISQKILVAIFLISSFVTLIITVVELRFDYQREVGLLKKNLSLVEQSYTESLSSSLWELNMGQVQTQLNGITSIPGIKHVAIYDNNIFLAQSGAIPKNTLLKTVNLFHRDDLGRQKSLGKFIIYGDMDLVFEKISMKIFTIFITQFLKTLLVSFLIYICIQHIITKHLVHIATFFANLDLKSIDKDLTLSRSQLDSEDELDVLVNSINMMRKKIFKSYQELSYLNKELEEKVEMKTQIVLEQRKVLEYSSRMSSLGEMAGGIAHEINNPLMIIRTAASVMKKAVESGNTQPEKLSNYCDKIENTTDRISKIIHGLLVLSRDTSEEGHSVFTLGENITDVLDLCGEKFKSVGIDIKVNLSPDILNMKILGRRVQFSQVFLNLLHNSYDAIEELEERWIQIDGEIEDNKLYIYFMDSGKGIPQAIQDKIMDPFFTTKEIGRGTGLGLSLSMSIIKNHKGDFYIDRNSPNTKFVISIPLAENILDPLRPLVITSNEFTDYGLHH